MTQDSLRLAASIRPFTAKPAKALANSRQILTIWGIDDWVGPLIKLVGTKTKGARQFILIQIKFGH